MQQAFFVYFLESTMLGQMQTIPHQNFSSITENKRERKYLKNTEAKNCNQEIQINLTQGTFIPMVLKLECVLGSPGEFVKTD